EHFSQSGYPSGGMGELEKVVEQDFGVNINYYALIDYGAFRQAVNAVGGIDVTINSPDGRLYDPNRDWQTNGPLVNLRNGQHHLNGQQALDLARARGDPSQYGYSIGYEQSDFTRTANQRMMLLALKSKVKSASVITNPIRLGQLFDAIGKNVQTDFKANDMRRLYDVTKDIDTNSIKSISLNDVNGKNLLQSYQGFNGESALIPAAGLNNYSQIQAFLRGLTSNNPVVKESANVVVLNATDSYGLAAREQKILQARYINVTQIGDAGTNRATTLVIDNTGGKKPATKQLLQTIYGVTASTTNPYTSYHADFIVVVGADRAPSS
ncbi:MAG TPA: LCP family protein, partial [Candidatus Saccharimonadales bacterium]|nr:LCP family protein [Candidatus Saccharimonadales bacterium]